MITRCSARFTTQVERDVLTHGPASCIDLVEECASNGYHQSAGRLCDEDRGLHSRHIYLNRLVKREEQRLPHSMVITMDVEINM